MAFVGKSQAVAEFELGLVEVGPEPVQGVLAEQPGAQGVASGPAMMAPGCTTDWVVGQDDGVDNGALPWSGASRSLPSR